jgi:hypothetical protein
MGEGGSVADPDLVGSGPFWSDPDPDPGPNKRPPVFTFLVCVTTINTSGIAVV